MSATYTLSPQWSRAAGADLSSQRYLAVKTNAAETIVAVTAATDTVIGILGNGPDASGKEASIQSAGIALVKCAGTVTANTKVQITATGAIENVTTGATVIGTALASGVANDIISVLIQL